MLGIPCDSNGNFLPPHTPPPPHVPAGGASPNPWHPFGSRTEFDFAHYHFIEVQSSEGNINKALDMWAATVMEFGHDAPWKNATQLYQTIDNIQHGDAPWRLYSVRYKGPLPAGTPPKWMMESYDLCMRDSRQVLHHQLAMSDFADKINITPYRQFDSEGKRLWSNLMSADWAWKQAVCLLFSHDACIIDMLGRILLQRIKPLMAPCLSPLLRVVTKRLSPLPLDTNNIIPYICPPAT